MASCLWKEFVKRGESLINMMSNLSLELEIEGGRKNFIIQKMFQIVTATQNVLRNFPWKFGGLLRKWKV